MLTLTAHLEASAAFEPQLTPSPRTRIAEFFLATMAKESTIIEIVTTCTEYYTGIYNLQILLPFL